MLWLLVVVDKVDIDRFTALESEHDAPIGADTAAPLALPRPLQRVESVARYAEVSRSRGDIEVGQDPTDSRDKVLR